MGIFKNWGKSKHETQLKANCQRWIEKANDPDAQVRLKMLEGMYRSLAGSVAACKAFGTAPEFTDASLERLQKQSLELRLPTVIAALKDCDPRVRGVACLTLRLIMVLARVGGWSAIEATARQAKHDVRCLLDDTDDRVQQTARQLLEEHFR
jgi:hypothetical protein